MRNEMRMIEVGLLDSRREPDHRETLIQQCFRDVRSKTAVGPGDKSDFFEHVLGSPTEFQTRVRAIEIIA
jgi:hypothetical protein